MSTMKLFRQRFKDMLGVKHSLIGFVALLTFLTTSALLFTFGWDKQSQIYYTIGLASYVIFSIDTIIVYFLDK